MKLSMRVRSGTLAGRSFEFTGDRVRIGRQPGLELSMDPERDLTVSAVHAELFRTPAGWMIRDLESRNGTFVDGLRIEEPAAVGSGTRIAFGEGGPEVEVNVGGQAPVAATTPVESSALGSRRRLAPVLALAALALVALSAAVLVPAFLEDRSPAAATPSVDDPVDAGGPAGDGAAVSTSSQAGAAQEGAAQEGPAQPLRSEPPPPERSSDGRLLSVPLDVARIRAANEMAVALVFVEIAGELFTGTAFAVRPDGLLLTVRHVVLPDTAGPLPTRIGVQFANSSQVFPARLVATSIGDDLAAVRVQRLVGEVPVVGRFNTRLDTLAAGVPVVMIGARRPEGRAGATGAAGGGLMRPMLRAGILSRIEPARLEVHGYGEPGGSGSPIFDSSGTVVGVLFGGLEGDTDQVLVAVNASRAARFTARIP